MGGLVAAHGLLEELSLGIVAGEVDEDPAEGLGRAEGLQLIIEALLLSLQGLGGLLLEVLD